MYIYNDINASVPYILLRVIPSVEQVCVPPGKSPGGPNRDD